MPLTEKTAKQLRIGTPLQVRGNAVPHYNCNRKPRKPFVGKDTPYREIQSCGGIQEKGVLVGLKWAREGWITNDSYGRSFEAEKSVLLIRYRVSLIGKERLALPCDCDIILGHERPEGL